MSDNIYFASKPAEETADVLLRKANAWYNQLYNNGYLMKIRDVWMSYYNCNYGTGSSSHRVMFTGEQGEQVAISVNHLRNFGEHIIQMITANRPALQVRASNTDYKSIAQTKLAESLLDYYMREKRLEKYLKRAVEYAVVLGSGYIKMSWNSTSGEQYEVNEETGAPIYEGDVEFRNLSPFDAIFDMSKDSSFEQDWVICRTFKNKFDLAAKFPEKAEKIKGLQTKSDILRYRLDITPYDETTDVPIYEFFHKTTESMPDGRYILFLDSDLVLMDTPIPYRTLPVFRISPSDILGTTYGYTTLFDLMPLQEALNSLYSTILTNQNAFGVQNIYVPRQADVSVKAMEGGLNIIEGNAAAGKPEALNLTSTPPEIFNFASLLERQMETLSAVNSVARGNPESSLKSGAALALVQSQALQFMSGLQESYTQLIEDVGTGLINMLKDFASVPRLATISGKANKALYQETFTGDDLSQINRVIVEAGNPLSKSTAGKMQIAQEMMQYGIIKNPEDFLAVMETGRLDLMTDETYRETLNIRQENERLADGQPVKALIIDKHSIHINHHKTVLSDPTYRFDEELASRVLAHIQEHIDILRTGDPGLLAMMREQTLGPAQGTPPPPQQGPDVNQSQAPNPEQGPVAPPPTGAENMPNMPNMPAVPQNLLSNPEAQQMALGNVKV